MLSGNDPIGFNALADNSSVSALGETGVTQGSLEISEGLIGKGDCVRGEGLVSFDVLKEGSARL